MTVTTTLPADLRDTLRRMRSDPIKTYAFGRGIECKIGGCPIDAWVVVALLADDLIAEHELSDDRSEYRLTESGKTLAQAALETGAGGAGRG